MWRKDPKLGYTTELAAVPISYAAGAGLLRSGKLPRPAVALDQWRRRICGFAGGVRSGLASGEALAHLGHKGNIWVNGNEVLQAEVPEAGLTAHVDLGVFNAGENLVIQIIALPGRRRAMRRRPAFLLKACD